jgi:drug/metabolite transporter (DMT)-like permease
MYSFSYIYKLQAIEGNEENIMNAKIKTYLSDGTLLVVAALWGGGFIAVKNGLDSMTPMVLAAMRFIIATLVFAVVLHKKIGKLSKDDLIKGGIVGFFLYTAFAFQTVGLQYTTASKQGFLTATYVIMVPLIHWAIKKELPKWRVFAGSFMTFIGIGLVSYEGTLSFNLGDGLTLVCAVLFALHIIAIDYFGKGMSSFKLAFIQIAVAAICFSATALIVEPIPNNLSSDAWQAVIYLGVLSTFLCFTLQTIAQKHTMASHASMILSLESIFAAIFGVVLLGEVLTDKMLLGCLLIFIAIIMVEIQWPKKKKVLERQVLE